MPKFTEYSFLSTVILSVNTMVAVPGTPFAWVISTIIFGSAGFTLTKGTWDDALFIRKLYPVMAGLNPGMILSFTAIDTGLRFGRILIGKLPDLVMLLIVTCALMVATPTLLAVIRPLASTTATAGLLLE